MPTYTSKRRTRMYFLKNHTPIKEVLKKTVVNWNGKRIRRWKCLLVTGEEVWVSYKDLIRYSSP